VAAAADGLTTTRLQRSVAGGLTTTRRPRSVAGVRLAAARSLLIPVVIAMILGPALPAWAHSRLLQTAPAASTTVTAPVPEVTLTFNEHVHQQFSVVVVSGPGGVSYSDGHVQVVDDVVHQKVYPLRSGSYTVEWRVVSADTHPVQGTFGFTVTLPPDLEPTAAPSSPVPSRLATPMAGHRGAPWWSWLVGAAVIGAAGLVLVLMRRRLAATDG
jgi:methionine-rich copper-binding protein CopC